MTAVVLALYAEGRSDARFLPVVIRRTVEKLLAHHQLFDIDVLDVIVVDQSVKWENPSQAERILAAARTTTGYHALIVHLDADGPTADRAYRERFAPGLERVGRAPDPLCRVLVPLMPIHTVEAWMLADAEAVCQVIGVSADPAALQMPQSARAIEGDSNPKMTLDQVIQRAAGHRSRRRRRLDASSLYEPLAQIIRLDRLEQLSAYQRFRGDLRQALSELRLLPAGA